MVLFASLAALLGAVALVGWHRVSLADSKSRRERRQRETLGEMLTPFPGTVPPSRPRHEAGE